MAKWVKDEQDRVLNEAREGGDKGNHQAGRLNILLRMILSEES